MGIYYRQGCQRPTGKDESETLLSNQQRVSMSDSPKWKEK